MQVNILPPGPPRMMEATVFATPNNAFMSYVQQRNNDLDHRMSTFYGAQGQAFLQSSSTFYHNYAQSYGLQKSEIIAEQTATATSHLNGLITPLEDIDDIRGAKGAVVDFLMANPPMTELMNQNRIDAYSEHWVNREGSAVGFQRESFRVVVNHMGRSGWDPTWNEETDEEEWSACSTDLEDEGGHLPSFQTQSNILKAWDIQNIALKKMLDPSSIDGFEVRPE